MLQNSRGKGGRQHQAREIFPAFFDGKRRGFAGAHADATMRL